METKFATIEVDIVREDLPAIRKHSPVKVGYDVWLLFRNIPRLFDLLGGPGPLDLFGRQELDELYFSWNPFDFWKVMWNAISLMNSVFLVFQDLIFLTAVTLLFSPLALLAPLAMFAAIPVLLLSLFRTTVNPSSKRNTFPNEKWFMLNGPVTWWWHLQNGRRAERLFKRPITLIHKRTKGFILDILGSLIGRSYDFESEAVMVTRQAIKNALLDGNTHKVVLLAHSTGAVTASVVVDLLLKDGEIGDRQLHKLEIYTFGSAADEMKGGFLDTRRIPHIEHYINSHDFVAQTGVNHYKRLNRANYAGNIFKAYKKGHLFNQHYSHLLEKKAYTSRNGIKSRLYEYLKGGIPSSELMGKFEMAFGSQ
jgi:hypothetical protein